MEPLVSVIVITYNHVNYIKACLDGILMQKTDFPYELVIGEDCSNDGTREIVLQYQTISPKIVKVITSEKNVGWKKNSERAREISNGKYFAICDGDDYWNDPYKLKKQISFLETHPDYGMVYSDVNITNERNEIIDSTKQYDHLRNKYVSGYIFWDLLATCFINTLTVVVRRNIFEEINSVVLDNKKKYWFIYDYWWWMHISKNYKIKFIDEKMATYRIQPDGISRNKSFYEKRGFLVKLDVIASLNKNHFVTNENRNLIGRILGSMLFNRKIGVINNLIAFKYFIKYPPSISFIMSKISEKTNKINNE